MNEYLWTSFIHIPMQIYYDNFLITTIMLTYETELVLAIIHFQSTSCFVLLLIFLIEFKIRNSYKNSHRIHCFNMEIHLRFMQKVIRSLCQMGNNNLRNKVIIFSIKFLSKIKTEPVKYMFILKFVVQLLERNDNLNISFLFSIHLNHQTNRVPQY